MESFLVVQFMIVMRSYKSMWSHRAGCIKCVERLATFTHHITNILIIAIVVVQQALLSLSARSVYIKC